jgi:hypothetical protein
MSGKERMFAKVVLASKPTNGAPPIFTIHAHYPDIIHGEVMTHRDFARNARSMRAVPVKTLLEEIRSDPFVPWHWGKNQKGMQAAEECTELVRSKWGSRPDEWDLVSREEAWRLEAAHAADKAEAYAEAGYHKQIANRLIAPYSWKHTLITSTKWANFLHLRDHSDAEPHFEDLAKMVREALLTAQFNTLEPEMWHLPYITQDDRDQVRRLVGSGIGSTEQFWKILLKLSTARCARISYKPFDGDGSIESEIRRHDDLVGAKPLHASPTEHQATPCARTYFPGELVPNGYANDNLNGNLSPGWIQYRKTLAGEYVSEAA